MRHWGYKQTCQRPITHSDCQGFLNPHRLWLRVDMVWVWVLFLNPRKTRTCGQVVTGFNLQLTLHVFENSQHLDSISGKPRMHRFPHHENTLANAFQKSHRVSNICRHVHDGHNS
jgi:hypothetical protein